MTIYQSSPETILVGKIPYVAKWKLEIEVYPVLIKNLEIFDVSEKEQYHLASLHDMKIVVEYDQETLISGKLNTNHSITKYLLDDHDQTQHSLTVQLLGKTDDHSVLVDDNSVSLSAALRISIEDSPVTLILFGVEPFLLGENKKISVPIQTPIYQWLVYHGWRIINSMDHK